MAFLYEEDRGLTQTKDPYPHLGPGVYQLPETQTRVAYAPFLSTGKRKTELTNKQKIQNPGPGQYEISLNMGDTGVQAYMNKSTIIVKVQGNGSSAFKSGIERFQEDKKVKEIPGPGYYETEQINTQNRQPLFLNQKIDDIRSQNVRRRINSIPEGKSQIGMIYDDIETLAQHQKVMKEQKKQKVVGPTTYDIQQQQKQYRGLSWDKSTRPRFEQEQINEIGPGRYNIIEDKKQRNGSPAFLSESVRSYYDQLIYKTNREINAGLRKQINYKDQYSPGPGQYNENRVAIKIQQKPKEFQFFGSSLERFQQIQENSIGPGDYRVQDSSFDQQIRKKNYTNATFLSTSIKGEPILLEDQQQPGPGAYEIQKDLYSDLMKKQDRGLNGYFGGKEKRFLDKPSICQAGPGSYDINKGEKKRAVSSCFKSSSKRDSINKSYGPDIGQYRLDQDSIGNRIYKQRKFIQNLQKIDVLKPGFDCGQPRFKENSDIQIVPTSYNYQVPPMSQKQITAPFKSQQPRLAYIGRQFSPGVGKYQVDANNWKVNSFNTHYNKVLQES